MYMYVMASFSCFVLYLGMLFMHLFGLLGGEFGVVFLVDECVGGLGGIHTRMYMKWDETW